MYLLKKVIQFREKAHPDHEKPFLEHLEDLRVMITRVVITLLVSMIVCFSFQKQLMEVLRRPVEQVWITNLEKKLPTTEEDAPRPLGVDDWEIAKSVERAAAGLDAGQRELFYQSLADEDLVFHAKSVGLLRAALVIPVERRKAFFEALDAPDDLKKQVASLAVTAPSPEVDNRGNLKLMSALKPTETFMLSMKLSFFGGIILAFPLLLLFILQFVLPGLHRHEKRLMWPAMAIGFGLFLGGVLFAYYAVLPRALAFFYEWSGNLGVSNDWRIGEYISFATTFTLLFGLSFELPVVVMVFVKLGLLTYDTMSNTRSYAMLAIFVAAAVLTPTPDILTMLLMAAPMIILYEICIWLAWFDRRKHRMQEEQEAREREEQLLAMPPVDIEVQRQKDALVADPWHDDYHDHVYNEEHYHGLEDDGAKKDSDVIDDVGITKGLPSPEAADDGWVTEYPQQDYHDSELPQTDEIPEIPLSKDAVTEAKGEADSDKKPDDDKKE